MSIRILTTGGTFDKHYDPITGTLGFAASHLPSLIDQARLAERPVVEAVLALDSLDMNDSHRAAILAACRASPERQIVVIHGTDTMVETARLLESARLDATIVLTGAMVPAEIDGSDARFNLGFAIASAGLLGPGVWIAMNGIARRGTQVRKNREAGRFESTQTHPGHTTP